MPLVEGLHQGEGLLGGVSVFLVGIPLELGEVVGCGRRGLSVGASDLGEHPGLASKGGGQPLRLGPVEGTGLAVFVPPDCGKALALDLEGVKLLGHEPADFLLPVHNEGQGRGLDPSGGELGPVLAGEGPGDVEAHQPVGLAAGPGRVVQVVVCLSGAQVLEALADGLVGLGGDPQPFSGLFPARLLHDPPGHQLPLPAGVGGDDQLGHVSAAHQGLDRPKLAAGLPDDHSFHLLRQHGQGQQVPLGPGLVVVLRRRQLHQVAQGPGDHIPLPLQAAVQGAPAAQYPGDLLAHRGFFRQYQCFCHIDTPCYLWVVPLYGTGKDE